MKFIEKESRVSAFRLINVFNTFRSLLHEDVLNMFIRKDNSTTRVLLVISTIREMSSLQE